MLKNIFLKSIIGFILVTVIFLSGQSVLAEEKKSLGGLDSTASEAGYNSGESMQSSRLPKIIGFYINSVLSMLGVTFLALVMWGAFDISGAGGNDEVVKKAKDRIKNGAIGILIILTAFFISKAFIDFVSQGVFNLSK